MLIAYVGCYTTPDRQGQGEGIGVFEVQTSGAWRRIQLVAGAENPSFLVTDPEQRFLYAVHGGDINLVSAYAIDRSSGRLAAINRQSSHGANPVSLAVDRTAGWLVVANYTGHTLAAYPLGADGAIGAATDVVDHSGPLGPNPERQETPHPHQVIWDPAGRFLAAPDLGQDRTYVYRLQDGKLVPNDPPFVAVPPGSGPRHIAFDALGRRAYIVHEMGNLLMACAYDAESGRLDPTQTLSTLPDDFRGASTAAEVAVSASGRFVWASNRGHDSIATYVIDPRDGTVAGVGWTPTQGAIPRHFALEPDGEILYAENQKSGTIVAFRVDQTSGLLTPTGHVVQTGSPSCLVFVTLD